MWVLQDWSELLRAWLQQPVGCSSSGTPRRGSAGVQLVLSTLPSLESAWLLSLIGAASSMAFTAIIVGISASGLTHGVAEGDLLGRFDVPPFERAVSIFEAIGQIMMSFSAVVVLVEVQHTLREPPESKVSMRKAIGTSYTTTFLLYLLVACMGYAALGRTASSTDSVLLHFSGVPAWVLLLGNALVLARMAATYQVVCQVRLQTGPDRSHALQSTTQEHTISSAPRRRTSCRRCSPCS